MYRLCSIVALIGLSISSHAQTFDKSLGEQPWTIVSSINGFSPETANQSYAIYETPKKEAGIILLTGAGQIKWDIRLKEKPLEVARIGTLVAVITGMEAAAKGDRDYCLAFLIDPAAGKLISEKRIPIPNRGFYFYPTVYRSIDGRFLKLGIHHTKRSRSTKNIFLYGIGVAKADRELSAISSMDIISLNKDLDVANTTTLKINVGNQDKEGSDMDINGNIILAYSDREAANITVQRFPEGRGESDKQISFPSGIRNKENVIHANLTASRLNPDIAFLGFNCLTEEKDRQIEIDRLDFSTSSRSSSRDILEKPYRRELESQPELKFKDVRSRPPLDFISDLQVVKFIDLGNTVLVCKTIKSGYLSNDNHPISANESSVITAYDPAMNKRYETVVPHEYRSYKAQGMGVDLVVRDNTAYFIANDSNKSLTKFDLLFGKIDVKSGNIISLEHLERQDISRGHPGDIYSTIWLRDRIVINYMELTSVFSNTTTVTPNLYRY